MKIHTVLLATGLLVGCGGKKDDAGSGDKTASGKTVDSGKSAAPAGPFAEFGSNDDILQKWQGAWVLETGALGHYEAWEVKGNVITTFDGKKETTRELQIDSPCAGRVVEKSAGGSSSTGLTFVFEGDTLHTGMGDAGIKKGDKILACGSGKIFVWDGKACVAHENSFGRWENKPTECKLDGGKFTAKRPGMDMSSTFVVQGDVLMSEQMKGNKVEKAATFAEAKTKLATFKK
jgi:hypothetical protein